MVLRASAECLRVLLCITCFSHEVLQKISELVPFVIAIDGPVDDNAAVEFVGAFYQSFFTTGRIERSFTAAKDFVEQLYGETSSARINPRLFRSFDKRRGATLVTVHLREGGDPLVMDISEAETSVNSLGMFTDHFVSILTRKVRFHRFLFDFPRERAILQIGPLFGIFSWKSADRVVVCHDVFRLAPHADARLAEWWASLVANYNDWLLEPYRLSQNTRNRLSPDSYRASLNKMRSYLLANTVKDRGRRGHGQELRLLETNLVETLGGSAIIFAMMQTAEQNLKLAQQNFSESKIDRVASCLEQMVSSIHDIINYLGDALAEKKGIIGHSK